MAITDFVIKDSLLIKYIGQDSVVIIPDEVKSIGEYAFDGNENITHVTIQHGVTTIGEYAFADCTNLETVILPDSLTIIEQGAFQSCISLGCIDIPNGVVSIGPCAFAVCERLSSVNIPNSVTSVGHGAFLRCETLESITLPKGITRIEYSAFKECYELERVDIPDGVTIIEEEAFQFCESLEFVFIPCSVKSIRIDAFSGCDALQMVVISSSTIDIDRGAFSTEGSMCIHGPANSYVEKYAEKQGIPYLEWDNEFEIENNILKHYVGYSGYVTIPEGVEAIADFAFSDAYDLVLVEIPGSVTSIGIDTFCNSSDYTISAPKGSFAEKYANEHRISFVPMENEAYTEDGWVVSYKNKQIVVRIPIGTTTIYYTATSGFSGPARIEIPCSVVKIDEYAFAYCEDLIICAPAGSFAEQYAKEKGYTFFAM